MMKWGFSESIILFKELNKNINDVETITIIEIEKTILKYGFFRKLNCNTFIIKI